MTKKTEDKKSEKKRTAAKKPSAKKTASKKASVDKSDVKKIIKEKPVVTGPVILEAADPKDQKILGERARELAETMEVQESADDIVEVVEFVLAYEKYAIESSHVNEVYPMKEYTTLPGTPNFVLGIINMRGSILTVMDIRGFFNLPVEGISNLNRVVVVG